MATTCSSGTVERAAYVTLGTPEGTGITCMQQQKIRGPFLTNLGSTSPLGKTAETEDLWREGSLPP